VTTVGFLTTTVVHWRLGKCWWWLSSLISVPFFLCTSVLPPEMMELMASHSHGVII